MIETGQIVARDVWITIEGHPADIRMYKDADDNWLVANCGVIVAKLRALNVVVRVGFRELRSEDYKSSQ